MLKQIVKHTNNRTRRDLRAKNRSPDEWVPVDLCEIKGVVGLLYLIGVYWSQHESLRSLWSSGRSGRPIFSASFGRNRFEQMQTYALIDVKTAARKINSLRFDKCRKSLLIIAESIVMLVRL